MWKNFKKNKVFVQCSGDCRDCRYSTKISTYPTCYVCGYGNVSISTPVLVLIYLTMIFVAGQCHYPACFLSRNTPARKGNLIVCLICLKPIADGDASKKLNRGGRHGVRHLTCGQSVGNCPYVVDLTGPLETEAHSATRNKTCFQPIVAEAASVWLLFVLCPCNAWMKGALGWR